jgi:hypothetical protein
VPGGDLQFVESRLDASSHGTIDRKAIRGDQMDAAEITLVGAAE